MRTVLDSTPVSKDNHSLAIRSQVKVRFIVHFTRNFMFEEDWGKTKLREPGRRKLEKLELLTGGEACSATF